MHKPNLDCLRYWLVMIAFSINKRITFLNYITYKLFLIILFTVKTSPLNLNLRSSTAFCSTFYQVSFQ